MVRYGILTSAVLKDSIAPLPDRRATLMVPQPSKVLPLLMLIVLAPIDPDAMTETRCLVLAFM
jgi:hypothetical protein